MALLEFGVMLFPFRLQIGGKLNLYQLTSTILHSQVIPGLTGIQRIPSLYTQSCIKCGGTKITRNIGCPIKSRMDSRIFWSSDCSILYLIKVPVGDRPLHPDCL